MEKMFYTISEVSEMLEEPASKIRYWSDKFPHQVKPRRTAKGNRQYMQADIDALRQIRLLSGRGLTLEGVAREMGKGSDRTDKTARALACLKDIKARLEEIKETL